MFRFCNCDGISASRKVSKSCRVNAGGGLACGGVAAAFAGGGEGSEINGDGAGPCANAADAVALKMNVTASFCTAANVPVARRMTRLRFCCERRLNRLDSLLQFFTMRARPINLIAAAAATKFIIIDLGQRLELTKNSLFGSRFEQRVAAETASEWR